MLSWSWLAFIEIRLGYRYTNFVVKKLISWRELYSIQKSIHKRAEQALPTVWKLIGTPIYRAHRAVIFVVAQLSCLNRTRVPIVTVINSLPLAYSIMQWLTSRLIIPVHVDRPLKDAWLDYCNALLIAEYDRSSGCYHNYCRYHNAAVQVFYACCCYLTTVHRHQWQGISNSHNGSRDILKKRPIKDQYSSSWEPHLRATGRHLPYNNNNNNNNNSTDDF